MTGLANANAHVPSQVPRGPGRVQPRVPGTGARPPIDLSGFTPVHVPDHPRGTPKPMVDETATAHEGMTRPFGRLSGAHGVISDAAPTPDLRGGMQTFSASRRTLRKAPLVPWDVGTELNR